MSTNSIRLDDFRNRRFDWNQRDGTHQTQYVVSGRIVSPRHFVQHRYAGYELEFGAQTVPP